MYPFLHKPFCHHFLNNQSFLLCILLQRSLWQYHIVYDCVQKGSLNKKNQNPLTALFNTHRHTNSHYICQSMVCMCIYNEINSTEVTVMFLKANEPQDLKLTNWGLRRANDLVPEDLSCKKSWCFSLSLKTRVKRCSYSKVVKQEGSLLIHYDFVPVYDMMCVKFQSLKYGNTAVKAPFLDKNALA